MISGEQILLLVVAGMLIAAGCTANPPAANQLDDFSKKSSVAPALTPTLPESYRAGPAGQQGLGITAVPSPLPAGQSPLSASGFESTSRISNFTNSSTSVRRSQDTLSENKPLIESPVNKITPATATIPHAAFDVNPATGDAPLTVSFRDTSDFRPTAWSWDFGDGSHSYVQHPSHTYTAAGEYTVRLTAGSGLNTPGPCCFAAHTITVYPAGRPEPHLVAYPTEGTSPLYVRFNDTSDYPVLQLPVSWHWDFDDGTSSVLQNPVHTFTRGRLYNVSFTVTNPRGSRQMSQNINVYVPVTRFTPNVTLGYSPLTVEFSDTSINAAALPTYYSWDFDDGTASNLQEPVHTFTEGKCYDVSFTVSSEAGTDSYTGTIPVYKPDFSAIPGYGGNPLAVLFEDTGYGCPTAEPTAWYWDFGDGYTSEKQNTVHQYIAPGTYDVKFRVNGPAGVAWVTKTAAVMII